MTCNVTDFPLCTGQAVKTAHWQTLLNGFTCPRWTLIRAHGHRHLETHITQYITPFLYNCLDLY